MAVNCWFIGEEESASMWKEYASGPEGVAIKSTIRKVWNSVSLFNKFSFIGKVNYVDFQTYEMPAFEAGQAHQRAFVKDKNKFSHEQELRISTMNIRTPACVDELGVGLKEEDISGSKMNNFEEPGIQVRVDLKNLFDSIVLAPGAQDWF